MSYLQPLITSAFASYTVSRGVYSDRAFGGSQGDADKTGVENVAGNQGVGAVTGPGKTQETGKSDQRTDPDAGKPKSASGDVLDLSQDAKQASEAGGETSLEKAKAELNKQADAKADTAKAEWSQESSKSDDSIELSSEAETEQSQKAASSGNDSSELTEEEEEQLQKLKSRDAEVRLHEQQHVSAGGPYVTGGPSYTYQTGPDGQKYAIGGEVSIDVSEISGDPEATIRKMQTVAAAALAPAEPSGADQNVAATARQSEAKARAELAQQQAAQMSGDSEDQEAESTSEAGMQASDETGEAASTDSKQAASIKTASASTASSQSAYRAQSRMVSGQTGGSLFSAYA